MPAQCPEEHPSSCVGMCNELNMKAAGRLALAVLSLAYMGGLLC